MILNEIANIYDCPHSTAPDEGEGYALIRTPNIGKGRLLLDNVHRVSKEVYDKRNKRAIPQEGDIIFAREAPAGNAALITKGQNVCLGQRTVLIKPNQCVCNSEFLVYYLLAPEQQVKLLGFSHGATVQHVNIAELSKLGVTLPPLHIQQKIASILSAYDTLIENNTKRIRLLEQMAENLYKEWFVRFRFPGHENVEMENGLPKGWKNEKLGNVANISTGKCNREDAEEKGLYPLFDRSQEIKKSSIWLKDCEAIIVPGEGTSFIPRYYKGKFNLHQRCYCVEPTFERTGKYLFYMLMINRSYFLSVATGATVPSLRQNNFTKMTFVLPAKELVQKFDDIVSKCFKEIDSLKEQSILLTRQRDLLLPRLMSGKLEVKA